MTRAEYVRQTLVYRARLERLEAELARRELPAPAMAIVKAECDRVRAAIDEADRRVGVRAPS